MNESNPMGPEQPRPGGAPNDPGGESTSKRRHFMVGMAAAVFVKLLVIAVVLGVVGVSGCHRSRGDRHGSERMREHAHRAVEHALDDVDASDEQREQISVEIDALLSDLGDMRGNRDGMRGELRALLTAPSVDARALEGFRSEHLEKLDVATRRLTESTARIAEVLTQEQRIALADEAESRSGRHRGRWFH